MVGYHPAKLDSHKHSDSGDIMVLVCHVILQDEVIKELCELIGTIPSKYVIILPSLVAIGTAVLEI